MKIDHRKINAQAKKALKLLLKASKSLRPEAQLSSLEACFLEHPELVNKAIQVLISNDLSACRALRSEHLKPHVNDDLREYALRVLQPEQQSPLFPDLASVTPESISPLFPGMAF